MGDSPRRRPADQRQHADQAADLHARAGLCGRALQDRPDRALQGLQVPQADSFGYHPHPLLNAPDKKNPDNDEAQFADLSRLFSALDRLRAKKHLRVSGNIHLTEFGYQTNPPDKAVGISLANQTQYLQQAAFVAWKTKRVRGLSFYQWDDEPVVNRGGGTKRYSGWQTGLRFTTASPSPCSRRSPPPS